MHQARIVLWSGQKEGSLSPQRPLKAPLNDLKIPLNARKYPYNMAPQLSKNGPVFIPWNGGETAAVQFGLQSGRVRPCAPSIARLAVYAAVHVQNLLPLLLCYEHSLATPLETRRSRKRMRS